MVEWNYRRRKSGTKESEDTTKTTSSTSSTSSTPSAGADSSKVSQEKREHSHVEPKMEEQSTSKKDESGSEELMQGIASLKQAVQGCMNAIQNLQQRSVREDPPALPPSESYGDLEERLDRMLKQLENDDGSLKKPLTAEDLAEFERKLSEEQPVLQAVEAQSEEIGKLQETIKSLQQDLEETKSAQKSMQESLNGTLDLLAEAEKNSQNQLTALNKNVSATVKKATEEGLGNTLKDLNAIKQSCDEMKAARTATPQNRLYHALFPWVIGVLIISAVFWSCGFSPSARYDLALAGIIFLFLALIFSVGTEVLVRLNKLASGGEIAFTVFVLLCTLTSLGLCMAEFLA